MKYQEITKQGINKLMDSFYAKVRADTGELGKIFRDTIGDDDESWEKHKTKIAAFWGGIFLGEQGVSRCAFARAFRSATIPKGAFYPMAQSLCAICAANL